MDTQKVFKTAEIKDLGQFRCGNLPIWERNLTVNVTVRNASSFIAFIYSLTTTDATY